MKKIYHFIKVLFALFALKPQPVWCKYRSVSVDPSETCDKLTSTPAWVRYPTPYCFACKSCGLSNPLRAVKGKSPNKILLTLLLIAAASAGMAQSTIWKEGHCLQVEFRSEIVTNPAPQNHWDTNSGAAFLAYYIQTERPFPRSDEQTERFEVVSNTYSVFIIDGQSNQVAQASVKLGELTRTTKTTITAQTNVLSCETWKALP